eukprot:TRINITY_DN20391_c0_g2_i1.p1 TRINITY_DN20391_c0_g2~~TRINITY_DN20391_c0_g2_i1.p1  ORF type:complete len:327 (+),score=135.60 TRINITY_DN20391_c0_g2_i1:55-1035(+)
MKNASSPPHFRLWAPTGEPLPAIGAGFGKAILDLEAKWYNKDAWRVESFVKRDKDSLMWIDPAASKDSKKASVSGTVGYDDMERNIKYRGKTDESMKHTSELAFSRPVCCGEQRFKVEVSGNLVCENAAPINFPAFNIANPTTKVFWKAMLKKFTAEAMIVTGKSGPTTLNAWVQGEVNDDLAYGALAQYDLKEKKVKQFEGGVLNTFNLSNGVLATRAVTRNLDIFEGSVMPPAMEVAGKKVSVMAKAAHTVSSGNTDIVVASETKVCPRMDLKAKVEYQGLKDLKTAFAAVFSAPNGWRVAASYAIEDNKFGLRLAQGSTPAPL